MESYFPGEIRCLSLGRPLRVRRRIPRVARHRPFNAAVHLQPAAVHAALHRARIPVGHEAVPAIFQLQARRQVKLLDASTHVYIVQIRRIPLHIDAEYRQVGHVAELSRDVARANLPAIDIVQITLVSARRVARRLPRFIRNVAVAHKMHLRRRVMLPRPTFRHLPQLIAEHRIAPALDNADNPEIHRTETRKMEIAPPVVAVGCRIVGGVHCIVEYTLTQVAHRHSPDFTLFEVQRNSPLVGKRAIRIPDRRHTLDDTAARRAPRIPHRNLRSVIPQFRHLEEITQPQPTQPRIAMLVNLPAEPLDTIGKLLPELHATLHRRRHHSPQPLSERNPPRSHIVRHLAQKIILDPPRRIQVIVRRFSPVTRPYDVGKRNRPRNPPSIAPRLGNVISKFLFRCPAQHIADLNIHLRRHIDLTRDFYDTAVTVSRLRKILRALKSYAPSNVQFRRVILHPHMVRRRLEHRHVKSVLLIIIIHSRKQLGLRHPVILIRHAQVPQYIFVTRLRHQAAPRQLHPVLIRPRRDNLELPRRRVKIHLEIIRPVILRAKPRKLAPLLERHPLHQSPDFIIVRVKRQPLVLEIVDGKLLPVITRHHLRPYRAHRTRAPRIYPRKRLLLIMIHTPVLLRIHLHILRTARQLQPRVPVLLPIDIAAAPHRIQTRVKLHIVSPVRRYAEQPLVITQRYRLTVLTAAHIHRRPLRPVFRPDLLRYLLQRLVAIFAMVIDDDILRPVNLSHLPVRYATHPLIQAVHYHRHMLPRRSSQRELRLILTVHTLYHKDIPQQAPRPVKLQVIFPLHRRLLPRPVSLAQPVTLTPVVHIVIHLQHYVPVVPERKRQHIVTLYLRHQRRVVVRRHLRLLIPLPVIYLYNHIQMLF